MASVTSAYTHHDTHTHSMEFHIWCMAFYRSLSLPHTLWPNVGQCKFQWFTNRHVHTVTIRAMQLKKTLSYCWPQRAFLIWKLHPSTLKTRPHCPINKFKWLCIPFNRNRFELLKKQIVSVTSHAKESNKLFILKWKALLRAPILSTWLPLQWNRTAAFNMAFRVNAIVLLSSRHFPQWTWILHHHWNDSNARTIMSTDTGERWLVVVVVCLGNIEYRIRNRGMRNTRGVRMCNTHAMAMRWIQPSVDH